jgi:hypothetical protein
MMIIPAKMDLNAGRFNTTRSRTFRKPEYPKNRGSRLVYGHRDMAISKS